MTDTQDSAESDLIGNWLPRPTGPSAPRGEGSISCRAEDRCRAGQQGDTVSPIGEGGCPHLVLARLSLPLVGPVRTSPKRGPLRYSCPQDPGRHLQLVSWVDSCKRADAQLTAVVSGGAAPTGLAAPAASVHSPTRAGSALRAAVAQPDSSLTRKVTLQAQEVGRI